MGAKNGAGLWGGGQWGAPPNFYMHPTPPQRSVMYNGGGFTMPTGELRCVAPQPILPSIADVLRSAAAGQDSLLGSAMAAGIFAPQTRAPHSPMSPAIASGSRETSFPEPDFANASASTPVQAPLIAQLAANIYDGQNRLSATALPSAVNCGTPCDIPVALSLPSEPSEGTSSSSGVATPPVLLSDRRPLQALMFEEFLREEHTSGVVVVAERMPGSVHDDGGQRPIALAGWVVLDVDRWWADVRRWTGEPEAVNGVCHTLHPCTLHPNLAPHLRREEPNGALQRLTRAPSRRARVLHDAAAARLQAAQPRAPPRHLRARLRAPAHGRGARLPLRQRALPPVPPALARLPPWGLSPRTSNVRGC